MSAPVRTSHRVGPATAAAVALLLVFGAAPASAAPAPPAAPTAAPGRYIVTLTQKPLATYDGAVKGLAATKPVKGKRLSTTSSAAQRYRGYLRQKQTEAAARVGVTPDRRYDVGLNGFVADLTPSQARTLAGAKGVLNVSKDTRRELTDDRNSADFLKLTGDNGVWASLGGAAKAGRGVVVGILDTGVWPENPSFAGSPLGTAAPTAADPYRPYRSGGKIVMKKADGNTFSGTCQTGEEFTASLCSTKIVGARYFAEGFVAANGPLGTRDYTSPRDGDGHGSHTGSTAVGNADVAASVQGHSYGKISGVAPAAKIAVYKVGFTSDTGDEGIYTTDALDGVEAAITDGVDVINYSISGSDDVLDPVDLAFLSAASAGIFVAASAGNSGPGASTLDHVNPWLTTVAASTVKRYESTVKLGSGAAYSGVSTTVFGTVPSSPLVLSSTVRTAAATAADANLCVADSLDPAKVAGTIVVCQRGVNARVEKSAEVKRAGGLGMVLTNPVVQDLEGDSHAVPTIHLNPPESDLVRTYAAQPGAMASLVEANTTGKQIAYPQISPFSSRGPSVGNGGDLLKPDIAAPGVDTLAAVAPPSNDGNDFAFYSGTSMSSPHIAGLAALYFGVHPTWSPMAVKSAMMTTAAKLKNADGSDSSDRFAQGAGNVRPDRMLNPGLVFDSSDNDWLGYLEGQGIDTETGVAAVDPSDYNSPSIAVGKLVSSQTITRRVTAVKPGLYRATLSVPGVVATASPSILIFNSVGETKTIKIKLTRRTASVDTAAFGTLYLSGAGTTARVPIAVTPVLVDAPQRVIGQGASGSVSYPINPGVSGSFPLTTFGLAKGVVDRGEVKAAGDPVGYPVTVPAGTKAVRFALAADVARADIDLAVYQVVDDELVLVGASRGPTGAEEVVFTAPEAGTYVAAVEPFADPPGAGETTFALTSQVLTPTSKDGNLTVTPANPTVTAGREVTVTVGWSGIDAAVPYLGWVEYPGGTGTFVLVN